MTNNAVSPAGIKIGNAALSAPTIVKAAGLSNTGTINLTGAPSVQATLDIAGAAPTTLIGVNNLTNDALLEYGSGAISGIGSGATLYLDGAKSRVALASATGGNSALTTLASNAGTLRLDAGALVHTTAALSNSGTHRGRRRQRQRRQPADHRRDLDQWRHDYDRQYRAQRGDDGLPRRGWRIAARSV